MNPYNKIASADHPNVSLKVIPGHFVTPNSHINSYVDMTTMKTRVSEAKAVAQALAGQYSRNLTVDTIICMDNTEVIGAYLAQELTSMGVGTANIHRTIYVVTPEYDAYGQMVFRDNMRIMLQDKHVLLLLASTTTGGTLKRAIGAVKYHGGETVGVSAIISLLDTVEKISVKALFSGKDVPGYETNTADKCRMCAKGVPIDAICNGFGYTEVGF